MGRLPRRGAHSQGLAAYGGRVGTRETTKLGSERLPADSVELRSSDFADQLLFGGVPEPAGAALSRGGARQRFKAVNLSLHDGDWSRATDPVELLPPSGRHFTSREEETLVAKELRDEIRVKRYQGCGTSSQSPGKGRGRGSGAPRPEARNGSVRRERGAVRERSRDGKRDKEKDQKKGDGKRRGRK